MSQTEKTVTRFWQTMVERYGTRWATTYGAEPTHAWRECLKPFSPRDIGSAIEALALKDSTRDFPPTEPDFRALLNAAARRALHKSDDPGQVRRGYWRSTIVAHVRDALGYRFAGNGDVAFEAMLAENKSLGVAMKTLLDDVDELEATVGQRTIGQETMVLERSREIAVAFNALKAAA